MKERGERQNKIPLQYILSTFTECRRRRRHRLLFESYVYDVLQTLHGKSVFGEFFRTVYANPRRRASRLPQTLSCPGKRPRQIFGGHRGEGGRTRLRVKPRLAVLAARRVEAKKVSYWLGITCKTITKHII